MTVNKITTPPTPQAQIDKINEIIDNLGGGGLAYTATCPAITITDGVATWAVTHNLGTQSVVATLYNISTGAEIEKNIVVTSNNALTVAWKASSNVTSGAYKIVVLASGASSDISNMQTTDNLVTSISSSSTDTQYPSAKLLYDQLALKSGINLWVSNYKAFYDNQSLSVSTVPTSYTIDLSTYLPNDGAEYEVMFRYNTNNAHNAMIDTDVASNIGQLFESNNNGQRAGQLILPIGSGRSLTFKVYTALNNFTFSAGAYRKVG